MAAYGWIKRGQKKCLHTNSGRQRLNLHGAINIETMDVTLIESETVNADSTIELLETLNQQYPLSRRLHIILDNACFIQQLKIYRPLNSIFLAHQKVPATVLAPQSSTPHQDKEPQGIRLPKDLQGR